MSVFDGLPTETKHLELRYWNSGKDDENVVTIVFPGILARGREQIDPVKGSLGRFIAVTYRKINDRMHDEITEVIVELYARGMKVRLVGISYGVYCIPEVELRMRRRGLAPVRDIPLDPPHGADTIKLIPSIARPLIKIPGIGFVIMMIFGFFMLKTPLSRVMLQPPKRENIVVPASEEGRSEAYKNWVIAMALKNLSGHPVGVYARQVVAMVRLNPSFTLLRLYGTPTVYIACVSEKNDVIDQPKAMQRALADYSDMKHIVVNSGHAAFLEDPAPFAAALKKAISMPI